MSNPQLVGVVWWPHSGGRWFCRSLVKPHPRVHETAFVHPWLFFSTDMTMEVDITAQVHKARSLPELKPHLAALKSSIDNGRITGLRDYFTYIRNNYLTEENPETHILGEMCLGSPIPRAIDLDALYKAVPDFKVIHLVRSPLESFPSFTVRHEMDSDPIKIAGSWLTLNAHVRTFFDQRPELGNQYLRIRYEDLTQNTEAIMHDVCEFMGIPFDPVMTEHIKQRWVRSTRPETPEDIRALMAQIASSELTTLGY